MSKYLSVGLVVMSAVFLAGCSEAAPSSQQDAQKTLEETQKKLQEAVPTPDITRSQTRKAVRERAMLFDSENKVTYIYLVSFGKVMAFYPVKGQVVSLRSYLTPVEKLVGRSGKDCYGSASECYVMGTADIDGTYGDNADGIFFFTADTNAYVEWKGDYMVSDQPLKLVTTPELVREIK